MNKAQALRLSPGQEVRVQHGNGVEILPERRIKVESARWLANPWRKVMLGSDINLAPIPLRANEAKRLSASALWVRVRDVDGNDWDSRELVQIGEGT